MQRPDLYAACHAAGGMSAFEWERDPRRLGFILARYKFAARMLEGRARVLEVGCADGFGSRIVRQHVGELTAIDIDAASIAAANAHQCASWPIRFWEHDILAEALCGFDAVYSLDLIEHMDPWTEERTYLEHLRAAAPVAVIGSPSLESQPYASGLSRRGHVNCKTGPGLRAALERHWNHVFLFGMNDETLHTGFAPMAHYRLAVCAG